ncbi:acyltransferase family protein [Candidatus Weimeria sp. HCP3S3_B5]|uniref:acyltransferase family protein n=1 Tax=Candidatus Weimeria sp. HCP3S3_B5 TaxID=3438871 RepID=UPI003F8B8DEE
MSYPLNKNCFDIIRAICTFIIFFGHFLTHFHIDNILLNGMAYFVRGVPIFFFMSGLFISNSLEKYTTKEYIKKRVLRIYPELWVCVLINLILLVISLWGQFSIKDIVIYLAMQLTFFQFYTGDWERSYGVGTPNGALWTITVDIQFYVLALILKHFFSNPEKRNRRIAITFMGGVLFDLIAEKFSKVYPDIFYKLLECNVFTFVWIFVLGIAFYYASPQVISFFVSWKWVFLAIYVAWQYFVPTTLVSLFDGIRYNVITTILLLFFVVGFGFSFKYRVKEDLSYSFYLYHMVVINAVIEFFGSEFSTMQDAFWFFIVFAIIGIFAYFSRKFVADKVSTFERLIESGRH